VLEILIYLHELSPPVLHRDIKPSNLIWGEDKHIYLVDFGAVQAQAAVTGVTFTVVGTSGYAPLEQFWGRAVPASDLYALGGTLIHLLTGMTPADLPQKDSRIQFSDRVTVNPSLVSWIEKMTEIGLEKRFSKAREALAALKSGNIQPADDRIANVRKIRKPTYSCIQVSKSATKLNITIPALLVRQPFLSAFLGIVILGTFRPLIPVFFAMKSIECLVISAIIIGLLVVLRGHGNQLTFYRNEFELEHQIFGWTYWQQTVEKSEIIGVFIYGSYEYKIKIRSGKYTITYFYVLGNNLKDTEAAWLAQEIQDWLNLR
jgi:serine/threonine protein kinase